MGYKSEKSRRPRRTRFSNIVTLVLAIVVPIAAILFFGPYIQSRIAAEPGGNTKPGQSQTSGTGQSSTTGQSTVAPKKPETILAGVSINGIDVSGMTKADALAATARLSKELLAGAAISITADGVSQQFTAADVSAATDREAVVEQALAYGKTGTDAERQQAAEQAKNAGKAFTVRIVAQREPVKTALTSLKQKVDRAPADASFQFMPSGFTADGKAYTPDPRKLADVQSTGKNLSRPGLVRVDPAEAPSKLRYQYWNVNKYIPGYIPADASVARFRYVPEVPGRELDIDALADQVVTRMNSGDLSAIAVTSHVIVPSVKVADLKKDTMLVSSWTSSYRTHASQARNWNVSRMSSFINGAVIEPDKSWSLNKAAGPRNEQTAATVGWKAAAGIIAGGYVDQEGGGVCQLSSSTYNAALRGGLTIASLKHHSIPSDYVPLGLDATISTPSPDLLLKNDNTKPVYFISYINPVDQNVTVEVYGQQPVHPTYGPVIYDYTSNNKGTKFGTPTTKMVYNTAVAPDGTVLSAAKPTHVYAMPRTGIEIQTYKHIYSLDGKELTEKTPYDSHKYQVINGTTYVFGPDPATLTPTPTPTPTPMPTPTAIVKPNEAQGER